MTKARSQFVDFNSVLMGLNVLVCGLIVSRYSQVQNNEFIDQATIMLGVMLAVQTHIALQLERAHRDPFVILLSFTTIFYFSLRLFTLALYPYSVVFYRYSYGPADSNFALTFIIVANLFLYAGFFSVKLREQKAIYSHAWKPLSPGRVIALMVVSIIYSYLSGIYWTPENQPKIVGFAGVFVSPPIILLMALAYFILFRRALSKITAMTIGGLIVLEMVAHTLAGSRSGITTLVQNIMLVVLAIAGCIRFKKMYFILGCVLAPVVLALLVGTFVISTFNRAHKDGAATVDISHAIELASEASSELSANSELEILLPPIFDRAGFFDYSAEIIAHSDRYKDVFSLSTYAKSIVDNLLTPGFDIYDQPKTSNALQFVYQDLGQPSKQEVTESYQSDQFGIYGEYYAVFGYASLPLLFLTSFLLKWGYARLWNENPFRLAMMRLIVLFVFVKIVNSYGMDWTVIEAVPFVVAIYLYQFLFRTRRFSIGEMSATRSGAASPSLQPTPVQH